MTFDPVNTFPDFYGNPVIRQLGRDRRWSISDAEKMPVNIPRLLDTGAITGASLYKLDSDTVTLATLTRRLPTASNCAYYVQAAEINYVLLDIEKTCPPEITHRLLKLADTHGLYTETSMSGKGYHILLPLPENFYDIEASTDKAKIQHPEGYYEVLLDHWVTFTRHPIDPEILAASATDPDNDDVVWEDVYAELAAAAATRQSADNVVHLDSADQLEPADYTEAQRAFDTEIADLVTDQVQATPRKSLSDFSFDTSRWEFSTLSLIVRRTAVLLSERLRMAQHDHPPATPAYGRLVTVTADHIVRIAYPVATATIPWREKHDGWRNGLPYLLYQTVEAVSLVEIPQLDQQDTHHQVVNGRWLNAGTVDDSPWQP